MAQSDSGASLPYREPVTVKPVSATGSTPRRPRGEAPEIAPLAIDGKRSTDWHTDCYSTTDLGG